MIRGLYQTASGMIAQQVRQEVIGENLANARTPGFKGQTVTMRTFPELMLYRMAGKQAQPLAPYVHGVMAYGLHINFAPGALQQTGRSTDLALVSTRSDAPPAFFAVQAGGQERFTRHGGFRVDGEGFLVTPQGYQVLGEDGPLWIGQQEFTVTADGRVLIDDDVIGQLAIVAFAQPGLLQRQGENLFTAPPAAGLEIARDYTVQQGFLEGANVDLVGELVQMLSVLRSFEAGQKTIWAMDSILGQAVNEIGRVK
jgi:flagellar basal-body rod protein FlgF